MEMNEMYDEIVTMMYTLWIQKFGLHHSEQLLKAFEFLYENQEDFQNLVQIAGDLCLAKHIKDMAP